MKLSILIFIFFMFLSASAQNNTLSLSVNVKGFDGDGVAYVALYTKDNDFDLNEKALDRKKVKIKKRKCKAVFSGLKVGKYAVLVFHDKDGDGELDTNWLGKPTEGVGSSNNNERRPSFEKSMIELKEDKIISITIKYL